MAATSISALEGAVLDVDYLIKGGEGLIRLTVKCNDGKAYKIFDEKFKPYFYFLPAKPMTPDEVSSINAMDQNGVIKPVKAVQKRKQLFGKDVDGFMVYTKIPGDVPKLGAAFTRYGRCYEYDIPFAKRYSIDTGVIPLSPYTISYYERDGNLFLESMTPNEKGKMPDLNVLAFDIEVYNPLLRPREEKDPVIMISYWFSSHGKEKRGVITWKKINRDFVETVADEKAALLRFVETVNENDIDIISGYNSANFDIKYLLERAKHLRIDFNLSRFEGDTKIERHGMVDRVKISGRVHIDMYLVTRFIAVVGASEYILKLNSYTLDNVYAALSGGKKMAADKKKMQQNTFRYWDGTDAERCELADYSLGDSEALMTIYTTFAPIIIELSRTTGDMLTDTSVSTAGQLVEFMLMRYAYAHGEVIPNKPAEGEMDARSSNPIEGAYVKTPEPGIYNDIVVFDFRGLYPSIIISHNIDPSSICTDCKEYHEAPNGVKFDKKRLSITPIILKYLVDQRSQVKKLYKKDPGNVVLGSRSQALKIIANSFYGYLGYARARWYSRDCAAAVTAYGRQYIKDNIAFAEQKGFKVIYSDTDSILMLLGDKKKEDALTFMKEVNAHLPETMELELEDFYTRGVFVGKKVQGDVTGAKKKYALISESGRIKIRGFELVRRDWSRISRETQRAVLEAILKEGSKEKAAEIVKDVIKKLREGKVPLSELVINTQLRKGIEGYKAIKSPELAAAKKAVEKGFKTRDEVEHSVIGYVITKHGSTISEKAMLEGMAEDYDPEYYINHQVIPATMRILKELDFSEEELKGLGKQRKLM